MRAKINSVHFKTDSKLEDFIQEKVAKLTNTYENIVGSDVTLKVENTSNEENKVAEIRLAVPGNDLFAKKQAKTFEEATDSALNALRKQLKKHKDKLKK
jgi:putative sigma-54 modulation protein